MSITIELSAEVEALLRAEAVQENRPVEDVAADQLAARYERARADALAVLKAPRQTVSESFAAMREKYAIPNLLHLSAKEIEEQAQAALANVSADRIAEAERQGLL